MNLPKLLTLTLLCSLALFASGYPKPRSFTHAQKIFKQMDLDYTRTAFSNDEYMYDPTTCLNKLYLKKDHNKSVVFVRIVPETLVAKGRECYTQPICTNMSGQKHKGLSCCRKADKNYKKYERDIFNIMPIVEGREYFNVEPPLHIRGNIARVYLYMNKYYHLNLDDKQLQKYELWHQQDSVDEKECVMHERIFKVQGRSNPWIKSSCETLESKDSKSSQE